MAFDISYYPKYLVSLVTKAVTVPFCAYCSTLLADETVLCIACTARISPVVSTTIPLTTSKSMKVIAISGYVDPIRSLILAKGFSNIAVSCQLGTLLWQHTNFKHMPCDIIVPVPLHWTRYAWRGYNQAEEMARVLAAHAQKPVASLVRRTHRTQFQSQISFDKRPENVGQAFTLSVQDFTLYHDKHIILVDDLMTSGATLRTVAKELLKLKPASITAVVAARVV